MSYGTDADVLRAIARWVSSLNTPSGETIAQLSRIANRLDAGAHRCDEDGHFFASPDQQASADGLGASSSLAPGESQERDVSAPVRSCLACGHLRPLAVWHSTTIVGICATCRDARLVVSAGATPQTPKDSNEELCAAIERVMLRYSGEGAPSYGDARYLADCCLERDAAIARMRCPDTEKPTLPYRPICLDCDGCGWCEGSPAYTCHTCKGTGIEPQ